MSNRFWNHYQDYKKHKKFFIIGIVIVFCIGIITTYQIKQKNALSSSGNSNNSQTTVDVFTVARGDLSKTIILSGQTTPKSQVDIAPKFLGQVISVNVALGQTVEKGQVLVEQDTREINNSINQNQAAFEQASADALTTEASVNANYIKAQADYKLAQDDYQRYKTLYEVGAVSRQQVDANAQVLTAAKTALDIFSNQMNSGTAATIVSAQAAASKAQYTVDAMQTQRDELILRAPQSGMIGYKQVEVGALLSVGQKILTIVDNSEIYVDCQVSAEDLAALTLGMHVNVKIDSLGKTLPGKIVYISPSTDASTQEFALRIVLDKPDADVRGGLFAQTEIKSVLRKNIVVVPKEAVLDKNGKSYVYIVNSQNTVEERIVQVGAVGDKNTEILTGLKEGDEIANSNLSRLFSGMVITRTQGGK